MTSKYHTLAMTVLVGLQTVLHMPSSNSLYIITITPFMAYFNVLYQIPLR